MPFGQMFAPCLMQQGVADDTRNSTTCFGLFPGGEEKEGPEADCHLSNAGCCQVLPVLL